MHALGLMEPSRTATPFSDAAWAFALATPGYRMLAETGADTARRTGPGVRLRSRRGVDATRWFAEVAHALAALNLEHAVLDGEVCVLDAAGRSDLQRLHARALQPGPAGAASPVVMCLRDVLVWNDRDVRPLPWHERRRLLQSLALQGSPALRLERVVRAEGLWLHRQAQALGHESLHAHRTDAPYVAGRSLAWLSIAVNAQPQHLAA
jgi:bifunctional non-homologous end joining protein LigD